MISLSELDNISKATEQQEQQQSTLGQKAAETASAQQEQQYSEDMQSLLDAVQQMREREQVRNRLRTFAAGGGIHIDPSKRGTFTAAASRHGMGVQEFASRVLAHKENYSPAMVKKANFARNASHWHADGGPINIFNRGGYIEDGLRSLGVTGFRVTSGYRGPNSKVGHAGKRSGHARTLKDGSSGAIDIVPTSKTQQGWSNLEAQLRSPSVQKFLASFGGTILDERDPITMKKTGATGPHFHIGLGVIGNGNFYGHDNTSYSEQYPVAEYAANGQSGSFAPISVSPAQREFNPWWGAASDEDFMAQQYAAASGVGTGSIEPQWFALEYNQPKSDAPDWFADGGYLYPIYII